MKFTLYTADCQWNLANCLYPHQVVITDEASLQQAVAQDHVTAQYKDSYRSNATFIQSDCIVMDCDNDHSDEPADWVTPTVVATRFPEVPFMAVYSRSHMKVKGSRSARPRFHIYFPIPAITQQEEYAALKKRVQSEFPYFDANALDSARFLFATVQPLVEMYEGNRDLVEYLDEMAFTDWDAMTDLIPEGKRNNTLSHIAGRLVKRYGVTGEAHQQFLIEAEKCDPPLAEQELTQIWHSAAQFGQRVAQQEGYIPPEQYNASWTYKPADYSDVGQATMLAGTYAKVLRYSPQTDYIVYNGSFWEESKPKAQALAQELTAKQMDEAACALEQLLQELEHSGVTDALAQNSIKKAMADFDDRQTHLYERYAAAKEYLKYILRCRESKNISACLKEARPMVEIEQRVLDGNEFLLNTPSATYDLRKGLDGKQDHTPSDFITKQTMTDPSRQGMELWLDALDTFFCQDAELIAYVQRIAGLAAIGKVFVEALIIAYGDGRNGKSTFWNVISRVLGSYSGHLSADMLTVGCKRNVKPELAEAKGKRLLIAAELEEGMRLNTSNIKQMCSTDEVFAEKKFKDPFAYVPTHTLVLYTNHLPRVGAIDQGTWRRLIVIPFHAVIEGTEDVKNYADYLFDHAGGAVLSWIIEGARLVITEGYHITLPDQVEQAIRDYKENNDWMKHFLEDCCDVGKDCTARSGEVYSTYREYCMRTGEYTRGTADFYKALDLNGFTRRRNNKGSVIYGMSLRSEFLV